MAAKMNMNLYLLVLCLIQLVVSTPIQKVIKNHCDGHDCEINIKYNDDSRDISLQTISNDSVVSASLDISIPHDENSDQNDLVRLMRNVIAMLSSMMQTQQDNHQQLDNMVQQLDMEFQPSPTPELLDYLTTSPEPEIVTTQPIITTPAAQMQDCVNAPSSGQYRISPLNGGINPFLVVCDMDTTSGGWIVIQRRFDGSVSFDRNWVDYENGFGSLDGEFWLGLSKMHTITSHGTWKVRFDLEDFDGNQRYAEYDYFQVGDEASNYRLAISSYSGNAGEAFLVHGHESNGMAFTTKDQDNDQYNSDNCGINRGGGWWHRHCTYTNLNGQYLGEGGQHGIYWYQWKGAASLKKTEMKIKCID